MIAEHGAPDRRRADLQGLRALAVLAVVAYHFGVPGVSGGFVGVDVFFVLSGFFITRLLLREIEEQGRIRLALFWANRAKRLLPNGLLCILTILLASILLLPSYRLPGLSLDALSAAAFFANFHFAAQAVDYFHLDVPESPLLHFWSLAVEEQFYAVLPLLVMLVTCVTRRSPPPASGIGSASRHCRGLLRRRYDDDRARSAQGLLPSPVPRVATGARRLRRAGFRATREPRAEPACRRRSIWPRRNLCGHILARRRHVLSWRLGIVAYARHGHLGFRDRCQAGLLDAPGVFTHARHLYRRHVLQPLSLALAGRGFSGRALARRRPCRHWAGHGSFHGAGLAGLSFSGAPSAPQAADHA